MKPSRIALALLALLLAGCGAADPVAPNPTDAKPRFDSPYIGGGG